MLPTRFINIRYEFYRHLDWRNLGPRNITCVVRTIVAHPSNPAVLYAGTPGGIWKTSDGGASWFPILDCELNLDVESLEIFGRSPNIVYAGMNPNDLGSNMDVYRTEDEGATWNRMTEVPSSSSRAIAIHSFNHNIIYVAGDRSLHKSLDGGRSWLITSILVDGVKTNNYNGIFDGDIDDVKIDPDYPNKIYIAVRSRGLFKTIDSGNTWSRIGSSVNFTVRNDAGAEERTSLNGSFRTLLAIGTDRRAGKHGTQFLVAKVQGTILVSSNGGSTWRVLPGYDHGYDGQNWWDSCVAVCPSDEDFIVAGGDHIDYALNASNLTPTWNPLPNSLHEDQQSISFTPSNPNDFYFANDGYIGKARNRGSAVDKVSDGLVACQCFNVSVSQTQPLVVGCSTYHTGTIRTGRVFFQNWDWIDGPEGGLFEIDPQNENIIFNSPWGQSKLHRSRDGGSTWDRIPVTIDDGGTTRETYVEIIAIRPDNPRKIYAGGFFGRLHYSNDGGDTWNYVKYADGSPLLVDGGGTGRNNAISCFAYCPSDRNYLYLGTNSGYLWHTRTSATTASGWQEINTPYPTRRIGAIVVHPMVRDTIYLGYGTGGVRPLWRGVRQPNNTFLWTDISGLQSSTSIPMYSVSSLFQDWDDPRRIIAATRGGVFETRNEGDSWERFEHKLPRVPIVDMRLRIYDSKLYVAAYGRGIYTRAIYATSKRTLGETSEYGPAMVVRNSPFPEILYGWVGRDFNKSLNFIRSIDGINFIGKVTLWDSSDYGLALAYFNNRYIVAWTGRDSSHRLNIMQSSDGFIWSNKRTLIETSLSGPSLTVLGNRIFLSWRGQGNNWLNVMSSSDAITWTNKVILGETTLTSPSLANSDSYLYLGWRGVGNNWLNILRSSDGISFSNKRILGETTESRPALHLHKGKLHLSWEGVGNRLVNILTSNDGFIWDGKIIFTETCIGGPVLYHHGSSIVIGWTGTDFVHKQNIILKD